MKALRVTIDDATRATADISPKRLPVDPERLGRNDREQYEIAKETYFKLKDKFED